MTIKERVEETLKQYREITKSSDFNNLRDFYEEMKKEGVAVTKEYDLPPLDTIGRRLYETASKAQRRRS